MRPLLLALLLAAPPASAQRAGGAASGRIQPARWKSVLFIFPNTDAQFHYKGQPRRYKNSLAQDEMDAAAYAFRRLPALVRDLSGGLATLDPARVVIIDTPVRQVTREELAPDGTGRYFLSWDDAWPLIKDHPNWKALPPTWYDSVFVHWNSGPFYGPREGHEMLGRGWGLGTYWNKPGANFTYCTITPAPDSAWRDGMIGEPWLHEWLHGVAAYYRGKGYRMPRGDADGAGSHGYVRDPVKGWSGYYRDLMTGGVMEDGTATGITAAAWAGGPPPH